MKSVRWLCCVVILGWLLPCFAAAPSDPIPLDPAVRSGRLPNGLTYYVRRNVKPEKRVELRLAVNTGSVQEDDDQRGLAHMIEHLCFKGTRSFPKAELIHYLQSIGTNFGPDLNGYTSFDETVYLLTVPTDKAEILENGIKIMREWAHDLVFDPAEIDLERKVLIEEWRLGRGASQRMLDRLLPTALKGSKYAARLPIGTRESLEGMTHARIEQFYRDWYRPDLMAFVVVGDIDPAQMEEAIRKEFGSIPAPEKPRAKEPTPVPDNVAPLYGIVSDPENPYNVTMVAFKTPAPRYATLGDYRRGLAEQLFQECFNLRLAELIRQPNPPLVFAQVGYGHFWVRAKGAYQLMGVSPDGGTERALATLLTENERVRQHGFTPPELDRAKKSLLRSLEQRYLDREKTESNRLVHAYVAHFLTQDPAPGIEFEFQFAQQHLAGVAVDEVNALVRQWATPENQLIMVQSVEKAGVPLPAEPQLQQVFRQVAATRIDRYQEKQLAASLMPKPPVAGKVASRREVAEVGVTELTLSNGVRVLLKPTTFKNDEILFSSYRPGGQSLYPDDYNLSAQLAGGYAAESGLGEFTAPDLQKMLAGKTVAVHANVAPYFDAVTGRSSVQDLETALQLVHLYFTSRRADPAVFQSMVARIRPLTDNARLNPMASFYDEAQRVRFNQHPRTPGALPTEADWAAVGFDKVLRVYNERFGSAAGFTFTFTGAFTVEAITPLLETYLGSLPATAPAGSWKDLGVRPIDGPFRQDIRRGTDPKSLVLISVETPAAPALAEGHLVWSLGNIVERALIDRLRLELGGVYTVDCRSGIESTPYGRAFVELAIPCSPDNADKLVAIAQVELERMRRDGLRPDEIEKEVETQRRMNEKDLKDNSAWLWKLEMIDREHEPFTRLSHPEELIALLTPDNLRRVATQYFDLSKALRFTMYPTTPAAVAPVPAATAP